MKTNKSRQLDFNDLLFSPTEEEKVEDKVIYNGIPVNQSTFKAGLGARIHRWFRLTPSFGPELVREMLSVLQCEAGTVVLDPFAGAGTTMIECQLEGLTSFGIEINPFLNYVGNVCLNWDVDVVELETAFDVICEHFRDTSALVEFDSLEENGFTIPPIHNPTRWWRPDVLKDLLILKASIDIKSPNEPIRDFFRLALAEALVPDLTNVTLGRLQLHFIDRSQEEIQVLPVFISRANRMLDDMREIRATHLKRTSRVLQGDATKISELEIDRRVNCVITSPPYPNRYSYVWNTRPHLYFFDFFSTARQAADLDKATVGGTWGSATSVLAKGIIKAQYPVLEDVVGPIVGEIRKSDNLMANYAMKYFNLLAHQVVEMERVLATDARIAYVVGCSRLKGVYIETDVLLGKILEGLGLGYTVTAIERIRRRHSGKDLHESIVYAWKK